MLVACLLLLEPASALAGLYRARQMEVGAAIELSKNGHFRYQLDYGAVSEQAEGVWRVEGRTVRLTTRPAPRQPSFELVRDDPASSGELVLSLEPRGFGEDYRLEAIATDTAAASAAGSAVTARVASMPAAAICRQSNLRSPSTGRSAAISRSPEPAATTCCCDFTPTTSARPRSIESHSP